MTVGKAAGAVVVAVWTLLQSAVAGAPVPAATAQPATTVPAAVLANLRGMSEFRAWFNEHRGHIRLVFLLSPT